MVPAEVPDSASLVGLSFTMGVQGSRVSVVVGWDVPSASALACAAFPAVVSGVITCADPSSLAPACTVCSAVASLLVGNVPCMTAESDCWFEARAFFVSVTTTELVQAGGAGVVARVLFSGVDGTGDVSLCGSDDVSGGVDGSEPERLGIGVMIDGCVGGGNRGGDESGSVVRVNNDGICSRAVAVASKRAKGS